MLCHPKAIRRVLSLSLIVLHGGLPATTCNAQLLKSRSGLALSLFNFCRFERPLDFFDCSTVVLKRRASDTLIATHAGLRQHGSEARGLPALFSKC
jgi:hypothetical protein